MANTLYPAAALTIPVIPSALLVIPSTAPDIASTTPVIPSEVEGPLVARHELSKWKRGGTQGVAAQGFNRGVFGAAARFWGNDNERGPSTSLGTTML